MARAASSFRAVADASKSARRALRLSHEAAEICLVTHSLNAELRFDARVCQAGAQTL